MNVSEITLSYNTQPLSHQTGGEADPTALQQGRAADI